MKWLAPAHLELPHKRDVTQQEVRLWTRHAHPLEVLHWLIDKPGSRRREGQHGMGRRACDGRESMGWEGEHVMGGRACDGRESM